MSAAANNPEDDLNPGGLLTLGEIATLLQVSEDTVMRYHRDHGLPLYQRGPRGRLLGDRQAVTVWWRKFLLKRNGSAR